MRKPLFVSVLLMLSALISACGTPPPVASPQTTATPVEQVTATAAASAAPATTYPEGVTSLVTIKLREGLKWSDGKPLTAKDVIGTFDLWWAFSDISWQALHDVVAIDDRTIEFQVTKPSPLALRQILRSNPVTPYAQYDSWMDRAHALRMKNADRKGDEVKKFIEELRAFRPTEVVVSGPFRLDPASVTEKQMDLVKNPTGFNADKIDFEKLIVFYGETSNAVPLILSGDLDYGSHAYTPAELASFKNLPNIQIIRGPTGIGPGLFFNESVAPLDKKEVRQAFAYVIDRQETATAALGESGKPSKYMAGMSDLLVPQWLSPETIAKLNPYQKDLEKATELLTSIGFKQGADGIWMDDKGQPLAFDIMVPSDFADWLATAESASQQLNAFGIKTTIRGYESVDRNKTLDERKYQILVDTYIRVSPPHPARAFQLSMTNVNNPEAPDGTKINIQEYIDKASEGFDPDPQKKYVETLSLIHNDQLPVLGLFERYSNDVIDTQTRVTGWLPLDNPIYRNSTTGDNYISMQLLDGTLKVSETGDKSFRTSWAYPKPPEANLNYFGPKNLLRNGSDVAYSLQYPPFFWYKTEGEEYVPVLAESFELRSLK